MTVRNLSELDRDICQPLGRILQEAFADGFIGTGKINISHTIPTAALGTSWNGVYQLFTTLDAVATSLIVGANVKLHFTDNAGIIMRGAANAALQIMLTSSGTPDLTLGDVHGIALEYHLDHTGGGPTDAYCFHVHAGTYKWDGFLKIQNAGDAGDSFHSASSTKVVGFDSNSNIKKIPVKIHGGENLYYILVGEAMAEVTPS